MNNKIFLTSKEYYDSIHQCGLDYFERSIEYLSVKSTEYYSVIKQNEALRNALILFIYSFLFMRIFSFLCSCCKKSPVNSGNLSKNLQLLKKENEELNMKITKLSLKVNKSSEGVDMEKLKDVVKEEIQRIKGSSGDSKRNKDDEEIFTFFHDSLRDLWSEIKSIKSRLRETDVSQLSLNFDPKMFKMENGKKGISQSPEDKPGMNTKDNESQPANVLSEEINPPLDNIKETLEESKPEVPVPLVKSKPLIKPKMPKMVKPKFPKKKPMRMVPKPKIPMKTPTPVFENKPETSPLPPQQTPPIFEANIKEEETLPTNSNPKPPVQIPPAKVDPISEVNPPAPSNSQETPVIDKKPENQIAEEIVKNSPVKGKPIAVPQKPMFKGPRIPSRKIPSRMPKTRRIPRKPIKIMKKPTAPKKPTSTQGNTGI